jgi:hypothetical protein
MAVAEIWVSDRIRQKRIIQSAPLDETDRGRGSEVLAVRAVELLKASLSDFWNLATAAPSAAPPAPTSPAQAMGKQEQPAMQRQPFGAGPGAGVGAGVLESFGAVGITWAPHAVLSYGWPEGLSGRASFIGLGPAVTLSAPPGTARIEQQLVQIEAVKTWWPRLPVVPIVFVGMGAQHVHVTGTGNSPFQGHSSDNWSFLTTVGAGLAIPLVSTLSVLVQGRGLAAWPSSVVQIAGADAGRVGGPSLFLDGGLFGVLP